MWEDQKKIQIAKQTATNIAVVLGLFVFAFACVDFRVSPFLFAFLFASIYIRCYKSLGGICAFIFSLFCFQSQDQIISNIIATLTFFLLAYSLPRLKKKYGNRKFWRKCKLEYSLTFLFYIMSQVGSIYFASFDIVELYACIVNLLVGVIFLGVCIIFIVALYSRFNRIPWTIDQKICAGIFLMCASLGLGGLVYDGFDISKCVIVFIILFAATMFDVKHALIVGVCMGFGRSLVTLDLTYVAIYSLIAITAAMFKTKNKVLSIVAVFVTDIVLGYYFRIYYEYGFFELLPIIIACVLILVIPHALSKYFDFSGNILGGYLVSKNTINRNRAGVYKRLENLGDVFNEMQNIYKNLVVGSMPMEEGSKLLAQDISSIVCANCENRPNCRRDAKDAYNIYKAIDKLCYVALSKGSVNISDIPADLTMRCRKMNNMITKTNSLAEALQQREKRSAYLDASKVLMSALLTGFSKLCKNFAKDVCSGVVFDTDKAATIKNELLRAGIVASDCLLTKNPNGEYMVSVLVPRNVSRHKSIEKLISSTCGHRMTVDSIDDADTSGFSIVTVRTAPRYSLVFGVGQVAKNYGVTCGDTFTVLKITHSQSMMAICDGMGAGEEANRASVLALSLVENFYKAGFPNEMIMDSVNQLLIITEQEVFSAVDITVFSLTDGLVNFVKVGGVDGYIKRAREVEIIEAGSLPLGIVEEMAPKITRAHLAAKDMVILVSDGVSDSFNDRVALANFINNVEGKTVQSIADEIVAECLRRTDKIPIDDITVVVAQMIESKA